MNEARLLKIAEGLEQEKLPVTNEFYFGDLFIKCGAAGCAIAQFPGLFPDRWRKVDRSRSFITIQVFDEETNEWESWGFTSVAKFLNITPLQAQCLFDVTASHDLNPADFGCVELFRTSTAKEIAANIRAFIVWKKQNA